MAQLFLGFSLRRAATEWPWLQSSLWWLEASILGAFWRLCSWLPPDRAVAMVMHQAPLAPRRLSSLAGLTKGVNLES